MRPNYITNEDLLRWDAAIDSNPLIPAHMANSAIIREVCYAGQWIREKLLELKCPEVLIGRILFTAGQMCFGRDPWEIHHNILDEYIDGTLEFDVEPEFSLN
jgi:hypothetical protein